MKTLAIILITVSLMCSRFTGRGAVFYVNGNNPHPAAPFADWDSAATNIQDAIDAATDGDQIWVTNGVYQTGGRVMAGDLMNRVALNKAVAVQSVNGPWVTTIQGAGPVGLAAVRCAWLTNNAALIGFTLKWGATRANGDTYALESGGGIWCASSNAVVANCVIVSNAATMYGGGGYQGALANCLIYSNTVYFGMGGGVCNASLRNCTVISNASTGIYQTGAAPVLATNCIVRFNNPNYSGNVGFAYCCLSSMAAGPGNFTNDPQLFVDGVRLASTSPCIGAGINVATGTDIFGKAWASPPSVGCAEFDPAPLVTKPLVQLTGDPVGFTVGKAAMAGQPPFACWWLKDGAPLSDNGHFSFTQTTNLIATGVSFADAGSYQLVVSNAFGVVTSAVAQLAVHCVDVAGANPVAPYSNWTTAATNIQDAIAAASAGEVVLATNGLYATGGKSMDSIITNRVSVDKAVLVQSVNGPNATIIQGAWDPVSTNGPAAVRCVWLTTNGILSGFTLRGGATRTGSSWPASGGGVWGSEPAKAPTATVANCVITGNTAASDGGGAYAVVLHDCVIASNCVGIGFTSSFGGGAFGCNLRNCTVTANIAMNGSGGGVDDGFLQNCAITRNVALNNGGGAQYCSLVNCTLTENQVTSTSSGSGGGVANCALSNCIVMANSAVFSPSTSNSYSSTFSFSCTAPTASGTGNVASDPLLLADGIHLSAGSPCIGAGTNIAAFTDIDGQPWNTPPAIGCDEWQPAPAIGTQPSCQINTPAHGLTLSVVVAGQSPFNCSWSLNGAPIQDDGHFSNSGTANLVVNHFGPDDAGLYQVVVSNSFGAVTSQVAQVVIHAVNAAGNNPVPPYSTWATAAPNIQDAIEVASAGDIVLVTNGIYATAGKVMAGDLTNRIVLDKPITVLSVNGYSATAIQGAWDPVSTNGPLAVRCAWLGDGAVLNGFTLQNGATRATGDSSSGGPLESGGGVWCSSKGIVSNCVLTNNSAVYGGGMAYGTLNNSLAVHNVAAYGGGAYYATLNNCTLLFNEALTPAGEVTHRGAGTYDCMVQNSIVLNNFDSWPVNVIYDDNYYYDPSYSSPKYSYSCTHPIPLPSTGNMDGASFTPQFLDLFHIAATSPCCGKGNALYASGTDLDGEPWNNPPSMGCDEVVASNLIGPLSVNLWAQQTNVLVNRNAFFQGTLTGHVASVAWSFGDGTTFTNFGASIWHQWTNAGNYTVTFTAYNNDHPAGVATNIIFQVLPLNEPQLQPALLLTNGFQFQFAGQWSANYTVQYATNLTPPVVWQTLQTITYNTKNTIQINDPAWTNNATRFYRVLAQ